MSDGLKNFRKLGVTALGISPDPPERQARFAEKNGLKIPLLSDEDHALAAAYGVWGVKKMYGKEYEGIIRSSFLIDERGRLIEAWYKVKPDQTVPKVLAALQEA